MKLSKLWLREWVNDSLTAQDLANQLTMAGLEVDAVSPVAGTFTQVIVAQIISTKPHPNADKLTLCEVSANTNKTLSVVCGAANVRSGLKVALAMVGACLPGDFKIKESKLRGEVSQGMLCSARELGMAECSEGIMELECDAPVGMDLREYLMLDDHVFDIDLTPNRADCFSVLGIAREVAVLNKLPLLEKTVAATLPDIEDVVAVRVKNPEACARYCGRVIRTISLQTSTPLWMGERLRRSGIRTVHPVVDVMNYVMLELGQPMHAFDLSTIKGEIHVRLSTDHEQLELLDDQKLTFHEKVLLIADQEKPLAMAGIMGGKASAVHANTQDIFLESAYFDPVGISGVARKFGLFSDSSQRFERGVDPKLQIKALERATELIVSLCGGKAGPIIEVCDKQYIPKTVCVCFDTNKVKKLTGLDISQEEMKALLTGLGMVIEREHTHFFDVIIPSYRFDIQQDVDLVEEIIRLYGYDKIHVQPMHAVLHAGKTCDTEKLSFILSRWFAARGYHEAINYSFVDPKLQKELYPKAQVMSLLNPISSELSQMRAGMWPGLIAALIYNVHRQKDTIQFFEIGVVFDVQNDQLIERPCIAGLLMGEHSSVNWSEPLRMFDFFDLKGDLQSLFIALQVQQVTFEAATHDALHPGQCAQIKINGVRAGWMGVLHPRLAGALDLNHEVLLFELNIDALSRSTIPRYKSISKYPKIRRDLSFLVDAKISVRDIESAIRATVQENWLKSFDVFDVYTGEGVPAGMKSLAIAITLQDENRTLVDAEINSLIAAIINTLERDFLIILKKALETECT